MFENIKVSLYGTRAEVDNKSKKKSKKGRAKASTAKRYVAIPSNKLGKAKAFHVFYKRTPRSKWKRLTDELAVFPSATRSNLEKNILIELYSQFLINEKYPIKIIKEPKAEPKPTPRPKPKPRPEPTPEPVLEEGEIVEVHLPELPPVPRVTSTKNQVVPKLRLIIMDELLSKGEEWPDARIENMIKKLWKAFANHPHLLTSDEFRRHIVSKEIVEQGRKKREEEALLSRSSFKEQLMEKEISLDPDTVDGEVKVQIKEVFNKIDMKNDDDQTRLVELKSGKRVNIDRQVLFVQVITEYNEFIQVNSDDILTNQSSFADAINKVKRDVTNIFNEAVQKGVYSYGEGAQYSVRLITPMIDARGDIPTIYLDREGNKTSGYGYSTGRQEVTDEEDLEDMLDDMFDELPMIIARYALVNNAAAVGFTGFVIERILK